MFEFQNNVVVKWHRTAIIHILKFEKGF